MARIATIIAVLTMSINAMAGGACKSGKCYNLTNEQISCIESAKHAFDMMGPECTNRPVGMTVKGCYCHFYTNVNSCVGFSMYDVSECND